MNIKRGDIYYADLSPVVGSEQGGIRPVLIVQNDIGNRYSPTVIAAAITSQHDKTELPTHIKVNADGCGLTKDSIVLLEQVRTIDKRRLKEKMGTLDDGSMFRVDHALSVSFGLPYQSVPAFSTDRTIKTFLNLKFRKVFCYILVKAMANIAIPKITLQIAKTL